MISPVSYTHLVAKIHKIVSKHHKEGYQIIIVGDKNHPEVIGINGWCDNKAVIINDVKSEIDGNLASKDICIVAQTTINRDVYKRQEQLWIWKLAAERFVRRLYKLRLQIQEKKK